MMTAATHGLLVGDASERLRRLAPAALAVSDSVRISSSLPFCEIVGIGGLLAEAVQMLHDPHATSPPVSRMQESARGS